jgi:hypothetical protein
LKHWHGLYFRSHWVWPGFDVGEAIPPTQITYSLTADPLSSDVVYSREHCGRFLKSSEWASVADQWTVVPRPGCLCCGENDQALRVTHGGYRCEKHADRNPCAIESCSRTIAAKGKLNEGHYWLCGEHWRIACPPGSPERRVYLRIRATARKRGFKVTSRWPQELESRYWRIWSRIVAIGRARCAGDIDMAEINKLFGWDEAA